MPARPAVALGFKVHIGWAAGVALGGGPEAPQVLGKRRIDMATTFEEGAVYHVGRDLPLDQAAALVRSSQERFERLAREALAAWLAELDAAGARPGAGAVLVASDRPLPPIEAVLRSHALIHAAEGALYRGVVARACEACGLPARLLAAKEALPAAPRALGLPGARLAARLAQMGKASGRPWTADQKEAALAAWLVLAEAR